MYVPPFDPVHAEKVRDFKGVPRYIRKARYPELFRLKYGKELIKDSLRSQPPAPQFQAWLDDVIRESGDAPDRFVIALHPFTKRWCLWEMVQNPKGGPGYYLTSMFHEEPKDGYLPADLTPSLHAHLRGRVGDYRHPTKQDLEIVRHYADRRLGKYVLDERLEEPARELERQRDREFEAWNHDFHSHIFNAVHDAANGADVRIRNGQIEVHGSKQRSFPDQAQYRERTKNEERYGSYQRQGFRIACRKGSRFDSEYLAAENAEITARLDKQRAERIERMQRLGLSRQKTL